MTRLAILLLLTITAYGAQAQNAVPAPPELPAKAYLLIDANSGQVIVEHNVDQQLPPASLTKMMTAYVLAEEINAGRVSDEDMVRISENAWSQNPIFQGSSLMWIEPGKDVSIADLQRGIIISSGNDATLAVAEHIAGTEAVFAEMMNNSAKKLGMDSSHYVNSHGLPDPAHKTTARDLATLAQAMINDHPEQYKIYKELEFTYNDIRQYNRNTLMLSDSSVDGIKTGYTKEAGFCLVASAQRSDMRLISVVLGSASTKTRKNETAALFNYGFHFYETRTIYTAGVELDAPRVWMGLQDHVPVGVREKVVLTLPRGSQEKLETDLELIPELMAPLALGDRVGTALLKLDGETLKEVPVVVLSSIEEAGFFARLWDRVLMFIAELFNAV